MTIVDWCCKLDSIFKCTLSFKPNRNSFYTTAFLIQLILIHLSRMRLKDEINECNTYSKYILKCPPVQENLKLFFNQFISEVWLGILAYTCSVCGDGVSWLRNITTFIQKHTTNYSYVLLMRYIHLNCVIIPTSDRPLGSTADETPVKFKTGAKKSCRLVKRCPGACGIRLL